jgi:putative ubiquitin-RnfH superfamily antitoxin RatB of RatAB toxin-antitoxin module
MRIEVVQARPGGAEIVRLDLPAGATVHDALAAAGIDARQVGIFGRRVSVDARLSDGDRIEIYRPLTIDPKEARRKRATRSGRARR